MTHPDTRPGEFGREQAKKLAAAIGEDLEERLRDAEGKDGDMRQDINIHRIYIPPFTQRVIMACGALLVVIAGWGGINIELMRHEMAERDQRQNQFNAEVLVQIATIKSDLAVTTGDVRRVESRTDKLEGRR